MANPQNVGDLLERKIDVCFGHVDVNGDGVFEEADVMALAARMISYQGVAFDAPQAQQLFKAFQVFVRNIAGELGLTSGQIGPDQWRKGMIGTFGENPALFDKVFRPLAESIWKLCDKNGDGHVDAEEFLCFQKAVGSSPENRQIAFERLDLNKDGVLSVEEILSAYKDYYTSRDPEAPGNWLYGDVWEAEIWDGTKVRL
ncbi:EF-hand domain-containing protein [Streptomyces sp. NPDC096033]|uniref:EF-hand domain-containing protein n=1 Tax=Streptomyces sp. NPDC096033 TaxID=3366071 RepID=UPI0038196494